MLFRPANYDILFNDVVYKTGILYNSGNIQYEISSSTLFTDAQLIRTYATPEFGWETWSSVNIQEVVSCIWCKNVNVTVYNNGSAKTYSPAGTVEGNLSLRFFNDVGTNDSITYNLTVDNSTYKAFNHSSNNWSTRVTFILSNVTNSTNFSIQRYNITNYKIADQWILSNSTGFIVYNATLFNGSEYTIITTTTPGASVLVLVGVATIIIGGTVYYLRRVRKL
jgi:hypothetical protein